MKYNFGSLEQLAADLRARTAGLNETHDELKSYVERLFGEWDSDAQRAYQAAQQQWDQAHLELTDTLERIAKVVEDGSIDMAAREAQNAAMF
ncbi:WXG100 family type VII secretion target [Rhodococcus sp. HNM0569]|uniref:WXG100 family type VII secretion target n=1 Tax=Rhodococcus sp. HNM0569 TaxID=2716340 RepID=UPI00146ED40F|nr:WXG100 family type VII secretion target [Rhodococcus sp. HNM0569]NLU81765.1 WXG100 family type VII secretion target [Rhodococcus sp. HNM0569]